MTKTNQSFPKPKKEKPNTVFVVEKDCELLEFLREKLQKLSRNNIKSLLSHKEVLVNSKPVSQFDYRLREGQRVEINHSHSRTNEPKSLIDIIYEDEEIIAINKPAGLLAIATDRETTRTAYHLLTEYVRIKNPKSRIFAVHRLDRETSGVMIVAKNENIKRLLQDNWTDIVLNRGYIALVEGRLLKKEDIIKSWLLETKTHFMYSSNTQGDGLEAVTEYKVISENDSYSLLSINLHTGRKNQIRVHMRDIGHSIAGDKKYDAMTNPMKRLCLHANILELKHPQTGEIMRFETPVPKLFNTLSRGQQH